MASITLNEKNILRAVKHTYIDTEEDVVILYMYNDNRSKDYNYDLELQIPVEEYPRLIEILRQAYVSNPIKWENWEG